MIVEITKDNFKELHTAAFEVNHEMSKLVVGRMKELAETAGEVQQTSKEEFDKYIMKWEVYRRIAMYLNTQLMPELDSLFAEFMPPQIQCPIND